MFMVGQNSSALIPKVNSALIVAPADSSYRSGMADRKRTITDADRKAGENLRRIWNEKRGPLKLTQEKAAERFGGSQGLISQYLNGHIALGPVAVLKFAQLLGVPPHDIRPDFQLKTIVPSEMPEDVAELAIRLATVPENVRRDAIGYLNVVLGNGNYFRFVHNAEKAAQARKPQQESTAAEADREPR